LREFKSNILEDKEAKTEKIYVSRSKSRRSIPSENVIENYLRDRGFRIVHAEDFSLLDQIEIFTNAKLVIGIHGAGLSHALWSENCNLIELMPINRVNRCFEWQTLICGGDYRVIYFNPNQSAEVNLIPQLELLNL
jgi:capsular polysaccharide biosynthesis protein